MAGEPFSCFARGLALKHADIGPARKDVAFGPHQQRSEWSLLYVVHGRSQVFYYLPAEQIERRICEREDAKRS
jgi:hypothetical protein